MYSLQGVSSQVKQTHACSEEEEEGERAAAAGGGLREVRFRSMAREQKTSWKNKAIRNKYNVLIFIRVAPQIYLEPSESSFSSLLLPTPLFSFLIW